MFTESAFTEQENYNEVVQVFLSLRLSSVWSSDHLEKKEDRASIKYSQGFFFSKVLQEGTLPNFYVSATNIST